MHAAVDEVVAHELLEQLLEQLWMLVKQVAVVEPVELPAATLFDVAVSAGETVHLVVAVVVVDDDDVNDVVVVVDDDDVDDGDVVDNLVADIVLADVIVVVAVVVVALFQLLFYTDLATALY